MLMICSTDIEKILKFYLFELISSIYCIYPLFSVDFCCCSCIDMIVGFNFRSI